LIQVHSFLVLRTHQFTLPLALTGQSINLIAHLLQALAEARAVHGQLLLQPEARLESDNKASRLAF
jgi:hypothetical protein